MPPSDEHAPTDRATSSRMVMAASIVWIAALALRFAAYVWAHRVTTFDDAYMFVRYADHMLAGWGPSWNPDGVHTYGTTSLLYLIVIVAVRAVFPVANESLLLVLTSATFALLSVLALAGLSIRVTRTPLVRQNGFTSAAVLATLLMSPMLLYHAVTGMDTTLSLFCNTLLVFATLELLERPDGHFVWWTVAAGYLAVAARPDNLIGAALFPPLCLLLLRRSADWRTARTYLGGLVAVLVVDLLIKWALFGLPLPLPFYAKSAGYYRGYAAAWAWNPVAYAWDFALVLLPFLVALFASMETTEGGLVIAFLAPVALTSAYYFTVVEIMGFEARFFFPLIPFVVVCAVLAVDRALARRTHAGAPEPDRRWVMRLVVIALLVSVTTRADLRNAVAQAYASRFLRPEAIYTASTAYVTPAGTLPPPLGWTPALAAVAELARQLPDGTRLALTEHGLIGARAPLATLVDISGLHDPYFARHGFSAEELWRRAPDLILLPPSAYTRMTAAILDSAEFQRQYDFFPGAFDYGLAVRRVGPRSSAVRAVVEDAWRSAYPALRMSDFLAQVR